MKYKGTRNQNIGPVRLLIVDDEPLARRGLRSYANDHPGVEVVGECGDGFQAIEAIERLRPDAVLLDVEMPELSGFDVIERIQTTTMPYVVFVTAHDQYALEAFRVHAIDYILKPADRHHMNEVFNRVIEEVRRGGVDDFNARLGAVVEQLERRNCERHTSALERITIKDGDRIIFVEAETIDWIEACGNYINLHVGQSKYLLKGTLTSLSSRLDRSIFLRVHRSTIVNTRSVKEFRTFLRGSYLILMKDNSKLFSSRRFHSRIQTFLKSTS
jgi:two-component system, LytTR family, response regulator